MAGSRLAGRAGIRRQRTEAHQARSTAPSAIGALATPHQTLEELYLLQKLMRGIGSDNVDFRLRQSDFSADGKRAGAPWLGMTIADIGAARPRAGGRQHPAQGSSAARAPPAPGGQEGRAAQSDPCRRRRSADAASRNKAIVAPSQLPAGAGAGGEGGGRAKDAAVPAERGAAARASVADARRRIAASLAVGQAPRVFLGNFAAASSAGRAAARAGAGARAHRSAHASASSARRPTASAAISPAPCRRADGLNAAADAGAAAQGLSCC